MQSTMMARLPTSGGGTKNIIGPDNPTCSQFPSDTEFRQMQSLEKEYEEIMERTKGKEKM